MTHPKGFAFPYGDVGEDGDVNLALSDLDRTVWIKHPPRNQKKTIEEWQEMKLAVSGSEALSKCSDAFLVHFMMVHRLRSFKAERNPFYAVEIFRLCCAAGIYPPMEVLDWLDEALEAFAKSKGQADIAELLGLKGGGPKARRGQNAYAKKVAEDRRMNLAHRVSYLVALFHISVGDAALMVHARLEQLGEDVPSREWIEEDYRKRWKRTLGDWNPESFKDFYGDEKKREILASFPDWSIPHKLKERFPGLKGSS